MRTESRLAIIGGGPAGREAARRGAASGASVTLVTRSLSWRPRLDQSAIQWLASEAAGAAAFGGAMARAVDMSRRRFEAEIDRLRRTPGVELIEGAACISAPNILDVTDPSGHTRRLSCTSLILAVGVETSTAIESERVLSAESLAGLPRIPRSTIVLGSEPFALEIASFISAQGIDVALVGARRPALDFLDRDLRDIAVALAGERRLRIVPDVTGLVDVGDDAGVLTTAGSRLEAEYVLACEGGICRTSALGLEGPGVRTAPDGRILVDANVRTNVPNIYAIGAVTGVRGAVNVLSRQAAVAVENALGGEASFDSHLIPIGAVCTPEVAAVGVGEEAASCAGIAVTAAVYRSLSGPGPSRAAKVVADRSTRRVLAVQAVGKGAVEAVHVGALAVHAGLTLDDLEEPAWIDGAMSGVLGSAAAATGRMPLAEATAPVIVGPE